LSEDSKAKYKRMIAISKLAFLVLLIVGVPAFLYINYGGEIFSEHFATDIISYLQSHKSRSLAILVSLQALQVIVCILPGQPIHIAGSYMFGIIGALLTSLAGAVIGATVSFFLSRLLGRDAMHVLFGEERINDYKEKLNSAKGILIVFLIYLIPGIPKDLTAYAAGISEMRFAPFLVASTVGRTPAMMGSILFGYFFKRHDYTAIAILCVISFLIVVICLIKRKRILSILDELARKGLKNEVSAHNE
jgi:uncharacterized membrane protein YdjX (TVP38/TMEM64 family)